MKAVGKPWQRPLRNSKRQGQRWEGQRQSCEGFKGLTHGVKRMWYSYLKGIQVASVLQAWSPACGTPGAW